MNRVRQRVKVAVFEIWYLAVNSVRAALYDAIAAALPIAIVYFAGWAYLAKYLAEFGIDATQVSITLSTVLVYAFVPLRSGGAMVYGLLALAVIGYMTTTQIPKTVRRLGVLFAILGTCLFLFVIDAAAARAARGMAKHVWRGEKSISVPVLSSSADGSETAKYKICADDGRLRQIIGLTDGMYVLCRDKYIPCYYGLMFAISIEGRIIYTAERRRQPERDEKCSS